MGIENPRILAVIPARGGSKGVPRKNVRMVGSKPLIAYTITAAAALKDQFHRLIVSTDDNEIAEIALKYGAEVPFMRPAELAGDSVPMVPVPACVLAPEGRIRLRYRMLLQPTCPFRA